MVDHPLTSFRNFRLTPSISRSDVQQRSLQGQTVRESTPMIARSTVHRELQIHHRVEATQESRRDNQGPIQREENRIISVDKDSGS